MQTMAQLLAGKDARIWSISPDATVFDALRLMADKDIGALVVVSIGNLIKATIEEQQFTIARLEQYIHS